LFFGLIALFSGIISLPFSWYYHFVLEEKFGFNKMTLKTFLGDLVKSMLLSVLLGGLILAFIVWVYLENPQQFWWIVWIVMSAFMIFMTAFYARLIVPIFNKQTELEDGDLKVAIHQLAVKLGFQLENIYIIDGSKRSTKANAYFTGLGSQKRIVLYDTLIKDLEEPEILAVLAHEVGHYKHKHTLSNIVLGLLQTGVMLFILSLFINPDSETALVLNQVVARDLTIDNTHFYLGIIGFGILYTPVSTLLGLLMNVLSRKFEYQADAFAANAELEEALKMGLIKLSKNSLSNLNPHPAYVFVNYSHPPLLARLQALEKMEKR
jgi:STE24 endopeptidase